MFYYLGTYLHETVEALSFLRLFNSISFRAISGAITALLFTILFGGRIILHFYRAGQRDTPRQYAGFSSSAHQVKTHGGGLIVAAVLLSALLWCKLHSVFVLLCLGAILWFAALGWIDDHLKVRHGSSDRGLSETAKLALQCIFAGCLALVYVVEELSPLPPGLAHPTLHTLFQESGDRSFLGVISPLSSLPWSPLPIRSILPTALTDSR